MNRTEQNRTEQIIKIPCTVCKDDGCGKFVTVENAKLIEIGCKICHTITCHEPGFSVHHSNLVIVGIYG